MSLSVPPVTLRPLLLPRLQAQLKYQPRFYWGNPAVHYDPVFNAHLDVMTSVCVRTVKTHSTARRYATQDETEYYGIRKYSAEVMAESPHSIEKLMKKCHAWNLDQRQMQHLLMPIQGFRHVDNRSFYTVSEHASMTLAKVLLVVKQWPGMFCHDEIWAIVKQVLAGTGFLISQGLQHTMLNLQNILVTSHGVVKIGAIHHVEDETPDGWVRTREALVQLAVRLIEESRDPCARCTGCRDGPSMLERVGSLRETLDITRCLTEESTGSGNSILGEAILEALRLTFITQAKGRRLGLIAEFASQKAWNELMPVLRSDSSHGNMTTFLPGHSERQRPEKRHRLTKQHKDARLRRLYGGGDKWFLYNHAKQTQVMRREDRGHEPSPA